MLTDPSQLDHLPENLGSTQPFPALVTIGAEIEALISGDAGHIDAAEGGSK